MYKIEFEYVFIYCLIVGIDEVGWGFWVGLVVVVVVIFDLDCIFEGFNDLKKLSEVKRNMLFDVII